LADKVLANSEQNYGIWKMTDQVLANSEGNYGVWKTQDWKVAEAERINYPHPLLMTASFLGNNSAKNHQKSVHVRQSASQNS